LPDENLVIATFSAHEPVCASLVRVNEYEFFPYPAFIQQSGTESLLVSPSRLGFCNDGPPSADEANASSAAKAPTRTITLRINHLLR
jgi:hypothetical protein